MKKSPRSQSKPPALVTLLWLPASVSAQIWLFFFSEKGGAVDFAGTPNRARKDRENFVTYQATYSLAGPPELRWGNLKGMSAWIERFAPSSDCGSKTPGEPEGQSSRMLTRKLDRVSYFYGVTCKVCVRLMSGRQYM
jgi:hypothetical protein